MVSYVRTPDAHGAFPLILDFAHDVILRTPFIHNLCDFKPWLRYWGIGLCDGRRVGRFLWNQRWVGGKW